MIYQMIILKVIIIEIDFINSFSLKKTGLKRFYPLEVVQYFVINISSPNTPNLREQQTDIAKLTNLLDRVLEVKSQLDHHHPEQYKPLFLKLSPDLTTEQLRNISSVVLRYSQPSSSSVIDYQKRTAVIDGFIVSNTTVQRPLSNENEILHIQQETGGLSGPPLKRLSTDTIRKLYQMTNGSVSIIGVGGIETGYDAFEKITAGATALQIYTSMTYQVSNNDDEIDVDQMIFCFLGSWYCS